MRVGRRLRRCEDTKRVYSDREREFTAFREVKRVDDAVVRVPKAILTSTEMRDDVGDYLSLNRDLHVVNMYSP